MVEIAVAIVTGITAVMVAWVVNISKRTAAIVNGRTDELLARVKLLETLLEFSRGEPPEDEVARRRRLNGDSA